MQTRNAFYTVAVTFLSLFVALFLPLMALAQESTPQGQVRQHVPVIQQVGEGNQYYLGAANELLMRVNVWGRVERPGQYFVPATTDLITLLSAAGGPTARSKITDIRVVRADPNGQGEVFIVNVRKFLKTGDKRLIPDLKPEDTVIVSASTWQLVTEVLQVGGALALIANAYYFIFIR
ncbi:SLBB domain-containing protein [bacterium]|nr:SLBB domain-containing protein [bacterium]MBU1984061.1 SLBB domain-containing protein [bacterium]